MKQLWLLTGGNGAGKSTLFRLFLEPHGIKFVNADLIAKEMSLDNPEEFSYQAAYFARKLFDELLEAGVSFCFETVFSHPSKIDFAAKAKSLGYTIILVYLHLESPTLNQARVTQRVNEGGHNVPMHKIRDRIPRTMRNISAVLPIVDEARFLDNSFKDDPFKLVATIKRGECQKIADPFPKWAEGMIQDGMGHQNSPC